MKNKIVPIMFGLIKSATFFNSLSIKKTGGTIRADYCYSVWLRHLYYWNTFRNEMPKTVAELGPGDSLGTSLAALLSGADRIVVLDIVKYWDADRNLEIFEELVLLFKNKKDVPGNETFPKIRPKISNYSFPSAIISDELLKKSLSVDRLDKIRKELTDIENPNNKYIKCQIPWNIDAKVKESSVDFIFSQAVMEYVEDLDKIYTLMGKWLKSNGLVSHTIDFKSDGITKTWNGHWTFSKFQWRIIKGNKKVIINRKPLSYHLEYLEKNDFEILELQNIVSCNLIKRSELSAEFSLITDVDMQTSGSYIIAGKK